jgi:hypothetical protein
MVTGTRLRAVWYTASFRRKLSGSSVPLLPFYDIPEEPCLHYFNTDMYRTVHFASSRGT